MSSMFRYALPVEQTQWAFEGQNETVFSWEYDDVRAELLKLYDKGKKQQWDATERIDWSTDLDPENPMEMDERSVQIYGTDVWDRLTAKEKAKVRHPMNSDQMQQFRRRIFTRIVPTVKDIGLWGPRVQKAYTDMGVMEFAQVDAAAILENDNRVAQEFDARRVVAERLGQTPATS